MDPRRLTPRLRGTPRPRLLHGQTGSDGRSLVLLGYEKENALVGPLPIQQGRKDDVCK